MPFVQIDATEGLAEAALTALADGVHQALQEAFGVPPDDCFQLVTTHRPGRLVADPSYLGVARTARGYVLVRITLRSGRTPAQKRALYATIAARAAAAGMRPEDVMVVLVENALIDWSFGGGVAQIAPPQA